MGQVLTLPAKIRTKQNQRVRMEKSSNGKPSQKANVPKRPKRWERRKNQCKRAHHPDAHLLLKWLPSTSNGLLAVALAWCNVLSVREPARSLRSRACSGSHTTPNGKRMPL